MDVRPGCDYDCAVRSRRHERNDFLAREIVQVHRMFHHFLDACSSGLVRTLFREWYSIAVVRKKVRPPRTSDARTALETPHTPRLTESLSISDALTRE